MWKAKMLTVLWRSHYRLFTLHNNKHVPDHSNYHTIFNVQEACIYWVFRVHLPPYIKLTLLLCKTWALWFVPNHYTPDSDLRSKEVHKLHGVFWNTNICYCSSLHSHLIETVSHLRTIWDMDQEIRWIPITETTFNISFFASQYKEKSCMTNVYGYSFESFVSLGADALMACFELSTVTNIFQVYFHWSSNIVKFLFS